MNPTIREWQKDAAGTLGTAWHTYETACLLLQHLDEKGFEPPKSFKRCQYEYLDRLWLTFKTGTEKDLYEMNDMIQETLRVVPAFDVDEDPFFFTCPTIYLPIDLKWVVSPYIYIDIKFSFDEALLEGLLGDFCVITKERKTSSFKYDKTRVTCFK